MLSIHNAAADEEVSPWLASQSPALKNLKSDIAFDEVPKYVDGNQECLTQEKFITRPAKKIPWQSEQSYLSCGVDTQFGTIDKTLWLTRSGTNIAGPVYLPDGSKARLSPLPNSDSALLLDFSAPSGAYITIERDISDRLSTSIGRWTGQVKHTLGPGSSQTVKDELSNRLYGRVDARGVSGSGDWLVFDAVGIGLVRLNVTTGEVLAFAPGYKYDSGQDPALEYAVSDDGRYVSVSSFTFSSFKIYDLSLCRPTAINKPQNCSSRDLRPLLQASLPNHLGTGSKLSFTDDYNLKFYGTALKDGVRTRYIQLFTAAGQETVEFPYLALGDSFASGEGVGSYKAGTDVRNPKNKCHLSSLSYPYLIGEKLGLNKYQSVACSGAEIKDVNSQFVIDYNYNKKGRQALGKESDDSDAEILENFLPGYRIQKEFVDKYRPEKITISMSGNDMGFGKIVRNCVFWNNDCYSKSYERAELAKTINDRFGELVKMYGQLKQPADSDIYVIGYPRLVDPDGSCAVNVHASHDELVFFDQLVDYLNSVIKKAADASGVYYVDVSDALVGHRLCEAGPGEIAVNGLTAGNDKLLDIGPIGNESYHPNTLGHELLMKTILEKIDSFSAHNPAPRQIAPPKMEDADSFIGNAEYNYTDTLYIITPAEDSWWYKSDLEQIEQQGFAPDSKVSVSLTSDPVSLGQFTADGQGAFSANLALPDSVPFGYHTLHVAGQNLAGESIEYQKEVFVATSDDDYDGDGIKNSEDPCQAIEPSGIDYDQDGIDDACDGQIDTPPTAPPSIGDTTPLPSFESSLENPNADILEVVDSQNQNTAYTQPTGGVGPQSQAATIPETSLNTQSQGAQSQSILLGTSTGYDTAALLNQTHVLGTSSPTQQTSAKPLETEKSGHVPILVISISLILMIVVALLFRMIDSSRDKD